MSKSKGNVINPDDIVYSHGADTLRLYEMFMGPLEQAMMAHDLLNYHPLDNGRTTAIRSADLLKFLRATGHEAQIADLA